MLRLHTPPRGAELSARGGEYAAGPGPFRGAGSAVRGTADLNAALVPGERDSMRPLLLLRLRVLLLPVPPLKIEPPEGEGGLKLDELSAG